MRSFILLCLFVLCGCNDQNTPMPHNHLPKDWTVSDIGSQSDIYSDPPPSKDSSRIQFYGITGNNTQYQLYSVPADTPIEDIIRYFNVGSHGADSYNFDAKQTIELVIEKANSISGVIPYRVIFADAAGLKLKFTRPITQNEFSQIETFFSEDEYMQAGLEKYLSSWDGKSSILAPMLKENLMHFWWD